jgi:hypothetical protein
MLAPRVPIMSCAVAPLLLIAAGAGGAEAQVRDSTQVRDSVPGADSLAVMDSLAPPPALPEEVVIYLGFLGDAFRDTPGGMSLIGVGMAEAEIAAERVRLAGQDSNNLARMVQNMSHVLHAIDPTEVGTGVGLGYGVKRAAQGVLLQIESAMLVEGASETVLFHGGYIAAAATATLSRADDAIAMARRIQRTTTPGQALPLIERLAALVRAMTYGADSDGDGRIGYPSTEAGLAQATYHLNLIKRVERLGG